MVQNELKTTLNSFESDFKIIRNYNNFIFFSAIIANYFAFPFFKIKVWLTYSMLLLFHQ